jgi:hypothetical protein
MTFPIRHEKALEGHDPAREHFSHASLRVPKADARRRRSPRPGDPARSAVAAGPSVSPAPREAPARQDLRRGSRAASYGVQGRSPCRTAEMS